MELINTLDTADAYFLSNERLFVDKEVSILEKQEYGPELVAVNFRHPTDRAAFDAEYPHMQSKVLLLMNHKNLFHV